MVDWKGPLQLPAGWYPGGKPLFDEQLSLQRCNERCKPLLRCVNLLSNRNHNLMLFYHLRQERETGIEPATTSLGS